MLLHTILDIRQVGMGWGREGGLVRIVAVDQGFEFYCFWLKIVGEELSWLKYSKMTFPFSPMSV